MPRLRKTIVTRANQRQKERFHIFQTCRAIFTGANALLRKREDVKVIVNNHKDALSRLRASVGERKLVKTLTHLLMLRVFESDERAEAEFSDMSKSLISGQASYMKASSTGLAFDNPIIIISSDEEEEEKDMNEPESEKEEPKCYNLRPRPLPKGFLVRGTQANVTTDLPGPAYPPNLFQNNNLNTIQTQTLPNTTVLQPRPSILPHFAHRNVWIPNQTQSRLTSNENTPRLPYSAQHSVLNTTQKVLEECCFEFAKRWAPQMIESEELDCPEAIELTSWCRIFAKHLRSVPKEAVTEPAGETIYILLDRTRHMRNSAVHRNLMPATQVLQFVHSAVKVTKALNDARRTMQLEQLQEHLQTEIKAMNEHKDAVEREIRQVEEPIAAEIKALEDKIQDLMKELWAKHQELERHKAGRGQILRRDRDFRSAAGSRIFAAVELLSTGVSQKNELLEKVEDAEYEPPEAIMESMQI